MFKYDDKIVTEVLNNEDFQKVYAVDSVQDAFFSRTIVPVFKSGKYTFTARSLNVDKNRLAFLLAGKGKLKDFIDLLKEVSTATKLSQLFGKDTRLNIDSFPLTTDADLVRTIASITSDVKLQLALYELVLMILGKLATKLTETGEVHHVMKVPYSDLTSAHIYDAARRAYILQKLNALNFENLPSRLSDATLLTFFQMGFGKFVTEMRGYQEVDYNVDLTLCLIRKSFTEDFRDSKSRVVMPAELRDHSEVQRARSLFSLFRLALSSKVEVATPEISLAVAAITSTLAAIEASPLWETTTINEAAAHLSVDHYSDDIGRTRGVVVAGHYEADPLFSVGWADDNPQKGSHHYHESSWLSSIYSGHVNHVVESFSKAASNIGRYVAGFFEDFPQLVANDFAIVKLKVSDGDILHYLLAVAPTQVKIAFDQERNEHYFVFRIQDKIEMSLVDREFIHGEAYVSDPRLALCYQESREASRSMNLDKGVFDPRRVKGGIFGKPESYAKKLGRSAQVAVPVNDKLAIRTSFLLTEVASSRQIDDDHFLNISPGVKMVAEQVHEALNLILDSMIEIGLDDQGENAGTTTNILKDELHDVAVRKMLTLIASIVNGSLTSSSMRITVNQVTSTLLAARTNNSLEFIDADQTKSTTAMDSRTFSSATQKGLFRAKIALEVYLQLLRDVDFATADQIKVLRASIKEHKFLSIVADQMTEQ